MKLDYYLNCLKYDNIPEFLIKYLATPSLLRLKDVGYFCGMDYASKDIYNFSEYISRYDHSLTVALMSYMLTKDKEQTLSGLFHDIATPCFSHVIDYMNGDYEKQESTEEYTEKILKSDTYLQECLGNDNIKLDDIINFKKYSVIDSDRPKICVDRLDGIILTAIGWTKNITLNDIKNIIDDITVFINECNEKEIGFKTLNIARKLVDINNMIDIYCHSKDDNYMMNLLAKITKLAIDKQYFTYYELYTYTEVELFKLLNNIDDNEISSYLYEFENVKSVDIKEIEMPMVKRRVIDALVNGVRISNLSKNML